MEEHEVGVTTVAKAYASDSGGTPSSKDWLYHTNHSLSRLNDVKRSTFRLGGGPKEREKNCLCDHRSKSKDSYLNMAAKPPELAAASQETASLPDVPVHKLLKQFHERQVDVKIKPKQRPHTATSCSSKDAMRNNEMKPVKKTPLEQGAFIAVKGCTVTPKPRPASGSLTTVVPSVTYDSSYKGVLRLDPQHVEETRRATLEGFRKYSATFAEDEESSSMPPAPRASPEPNSPARMTSSEDLELDESQGDAFGFSEDETSMDGSLETHSTATSASRPLVFEIPTGDVDYVSDDDGESVSCTTGRISTDYVAKSRLFLNEVTEKNNKEASELKDMFDNMEQMKTQISQLQISPRDMEELEVRHTRDEDPTGSSVSVVNMQLDNDPIQNEPLREGSTIETFWVEEHVPPVMGYALPIRNNRIRSASGRERARGAKIRRHLSDDALLLQGHTVSFLNSEDLAVSGMLRKHLPRRTVESSGSLDVLQSGEGETRQKKGDSSLPKDKRVTGRPPRPKTAFTKRKRPASKDSGHPCTGGESSREVVSDDNSVSVDCAAFHTSNAGRSSLKKCSSESNISKTLETGKPAKGKPTAKRSVTFKQEVLSPGRPGWLVHPEREAKLCGDCDQSKAVASASFRDKSSLSSFNEGIVIKDGLEVKSQDTEALKSQGDSFNENQPRSRTGQKDTAKILAQVKAATRSSCVQDECLCRNITRPTTGVISDTKAGKAVLSPGLRLLKQRPSRPSSAPIRRGEEGGAISGGGTGVERKPRVQSASVAHKRTTPDGAQTRARPFSAHIRRPSNKESRRNRAAVKALKEGFLFKEKPVRTSPPGPKIDTKSRRKKKENTNDEAFDDVGFVWGQGEGDVAPTEECEEVYTRLKGKGIDISMDTIKRGLMAPARRASELCMTNLSPSSSSGLLSRPEKWLPDEYARIKVWDNVLKHVE